MVTSKAGKLRPIQPVGRYLIGEEIASGGMASVHLGRLVGPVGFSRTVAIKKLHPQLAKDPEFAAMFLDEARLAARIQHPNVVQTLDVVAQRGELFLVMEYVPGEPLSSLLRRAAGRGERIPVRVVVTVIADALQGLHAAHEATTEHGESLQIVHRDVSPHNIMVGTDGIARVLDFGIAKAIGRLHTTREGEVKGKLAFMAPEQIRGGHVTRLADVFATAVVLWGALVGRKLFDADNEGRLLFQVLEEPIVAPSSLVPGIPPALDAVVMRGLARDPNGRFATARDMATALEEALGGVTSRQVATWLEEVAGEALARRARQLSQVEVLSTMPGALDDTDTDAVQASPPLTRPSPPPTALGGDGGPALEPASPRARPALSRPSLLAVALALGAGGVGVLVGAQRAVPVPSASAATPGAPTATSAVGTPSTALDPVTPTSASAEAGTPSAQTSRAPAASSDAPRKPGRRSNKLFVRE